VISDIVANSHQRIRQNLRIDNLMGEYGLGMHISSILALLYINRAVVQRNRFDLTELLASKLA